MDRFLGFNSLASINLVPRQLLDSEREVYQWFISDFSIGIGVVPPLFGALGLQIFIGCYLFSWSRLLDYFIFTYCFNFDLLLCSFPRDLLSYLIVFLYSHSQMMIMKPVAFVSLFL